MSVGQLQQSIEVLNKKESSKVEQKTITISSMELTKSHSKSRRIRRIQCENGLFLEVLCDGSLQGVKHKITDYGVFHFYSVGPNMVAIRSIMTGLYLSLEGSTLTTKEVFDGSCIFQEDLSESYYVYYTSWNGCGETPLALCLENDGKLCVKRFLSFRNFCSLRGILFKTVMLPKSQFLHFFTIARLLDS